MEHKKASYRALCVCLLVLCGSCGKDYWKANECTRAVPVPSLDASLFPDRTFKLDRGKGQAVERVTFPDGTELGIVHQGCEYFALGYEFRVTRPERGGNDIRYWYEYAAKLLERIEKANTSSLDLGKAKRRLREYAGSGEELSYGTELVYGGKLIQEAVVLQGVSHADGVMTIKIDCFLGPL